ncbi:MAG: thioredoxin-disulfide reductase [Euryarchaeota archaeon]|nr:thioredoxin-disulfide reductase [Euryarchaeota archaeon]MDE1835987.1 thioredoxin-disulfide reductase [Euryarchaeota archaeon]MDE1880971.1 thioredoxin-disulfide reductase [Euryarchaeota archaeon]MDE2046021.1 thioredoxin-disulfide reductase [Thermoplasmata archaeon]
MTAAASLRTRVAILGSGPAGLTAALYTARANLRPVVIAGVPAGGQLMITNEVENYPGFPEGIQGPELIDLFRKQAERFGTRILDDSVSRLDVKHRPFRLWTAGGTEIVADSVIVATGAQAKWLNVPGEEKLRGKGVSACATCDGFFFKGKELIVAGGGDTAMEEATFLTKFATKVTIVHRRDAFRASRIMAERAQKNPKIRVMWNSIIEEVLGDASVTGVRVRDTRTGQVKDVACGGVFVAIGHEPTTSLFRGVLDLDQVGYLKSVEHTRTSVTGVFAAGDVHDHRYRQAVTAAGMGCMAAIDAERWLAEEGMEGPAEETAGAPAAEAARAPPAPRVSAVSGAKG